MEAFPGASAESMDASLKKSCQALMTVRLYLTGEETGRGARFNTLPFSSITPPPLGDDFKSTAQQND
jgi:hypothetical protein